VGLARRGKDAQQARIDRGNAPARAPSGALSGRIHGIAGSGESRCRPFAKVREMFDRRIDMDCGDSRTDPVEPGETVTKDVCDLGQFGLGSGLFGVQFGSPELAGFAATLRAIA